VSASSEPDLGLMAFLIGCSFVSGKKPPGAAGIMRMRYFKSKGWL
jgi:hypothetical protein